MTYFHLECGEEGRPLKILGCFTAGWGPRLFNQAAPLSGVEKSRQQEMTTRAGQQPFSWGHLDLGTILGTYLGPVSHPETYREARATSSRLQERSRAQGNTRNGCLSWASSLALLCAHPALWEYPITQHIPARPVSGNQPLCPKRQLWVGLSPTPSVSESNANQLKAGN